MIPWLLVLIPIRFLTKLPSYVFRKLLHFIAFSCVTLMILAAESWQAAALVGIPFGRHKVKSRFTDGKKSWEGSLAMLLVSFISGMIVLRLVQKMDFSLALLSAGLGALLGTATELFSPSEYDTVTVPVVIAAVLLTIIL